MFQQIPVARGFGLQWHISLIWWGREVILSLVSRTSVDSAAVDGTKWNPRLIHPVSKPAGKTKRCNNYTDWTISGLLNSLCNDLHEFHGRKPVNLVPTIGYIFCKIAHSVTYNRHSTTNRSMKSLLFFSKTVFGRLLHEENHFGTSCKRCCALNANITWLSARKCRCHSLFQKDALLPREDLRKLLFGESFYILFIPLDAEVVCKSWSMSPKYAEKKSRILMALNTSWSFTFIIPLFAPANSRLNFIHKWKVEHGGKETVSIWQPVLALINYFDHKFSSVWSCMRFEEGELE